MSVQFSVVIPTHNRLAMLRRVLFALQDQKDAPDFEIIVVDDGSRDDTPRFLRQWRGARPLTCFRQACQGPGAARNRGVAHARGRLIAFLGDDTLPEPDWLARHAAAHRELGQRPDEAVLGRIDWPEAPAPTAFMHFINEWGPQFGFALIKDAERVPFNFFYTSNISLPRALLEASPFHTGFAHAAWEDVELAYRLQAAGLRLRYRPRARVIHAHPTSIASFLQRMERVGEAAVTFHRLHPELGSFLGLSPQGPPPLRAARLYALLARVCQALEAQQLPLIPLWKPLLRHHYLRGLHRGTPCPG